MKEAAARIKINKLLEAAGWRFFADADGPANIRLEPSVTLKTQDLDALGENKPTAKDPRERRLMIDTYCPFKDQISLNQFAA